MANPADYDSVVHRIYAAALDPQDFAGAAACISRLIGAEGASLVLHTTDSQQVLRATMVNYDHLPVDEILREYAEHWHTRNPQVQFERESPGALVYREDQETLSASGRRRSRIGSDRHDLPGSAEFHRWRHDRIGIRSQTTGYCRPSDTLAYAFAFSFTERGGPASAQQQALFARLMEHMRGAVALAHRLDTLQQRCEGLWQHLAQIAGPAAVLDNQGRTLFCNAAMQELARGPGLVRPLSDGFALSHPGDSRHLRSLMAAALALPPTAGVMRLSRQPGDPDHLLRVTPLPPASSAALATPAARVVLTISVPPSDDAASALQARFANLFGLTPAEAVVATHLMRGRSMADIAARLGVQPETVRTHARLIREKTGIHDKAELAHLLTRWA